jgi:hypothetical protein
MRLLNADAYTDLWDDGGDVTINPFRAFATDWSHREILPNTGHARIYEIEYTTLGDLLDILLVFDASWPGNCEEPYSIRNFKQLGELYDHTGAIVDIQVDVLDWQDDVNQVLFSLPELTGEQYVQLFYVEGNTWGSYITNVNGLGVGEYDALLTAYSLNSAGQALYHYFTITITKPLPFKINSIDPEKGHQGSYLPDVVITGENIDGPGLEVKLKKKDIFVIEANYVHVYPAGVVNCEFEIPLDAPLGLYSVEITNSVGGAGVGIEMFEVLGTPFPGLEDVTPPWLNFSPKGVCVDGDYAYIAGNNNGLHIFDISNPVSPTWVAQVEFPGTARRVVVKDGYAYVVGFEDGLKIVDVSQPDSAFFVTSVDTDGKAYDVAVQGGYAYVAADTADLRIIDIDPPETACIVKTISAEYDARYVAVSGNYVYLGSFHFSSPGGYYGQLHIINAEDPLSAFLVESLKGIDEPRGFEVGNGYVYMGEYDLEWDWEWYVVSRVSVIDVDPPEEVHVVKNIWGPYIVTDLAVSDGYAYVTDESKQLYIVDISVPQEAYTVKAVDTPGWSLGVYGSNGYTYVVDPGGLHTFDVNPPDSASIESTVGTPGDAHDVAVSGDYAYVADGEGGLKVIDIGSPESATIVETIYTPADASSIDVTAGNAYVATYYYYGDRGLVIFDIEPPGTAEIVNTVDMLAYEVAALGGYAYLAGNGLKIVDVDPPDEAHIIKELAPDTDYIAASNGYAYAVGDSLEIVDVSLPEDAFVVGTIPLPGYNRRLAISPGYAFVTNKYNGLHIIDTDPPESPFIIKSILTPGDANDVALSPSYAFVTHSYDYYLGSAGFDIIDITSINDAHHVYSVNTPLNPLGIAVSGDYAYVACEYGGLRIFKLW